MVPSYPSPAGWCWSDLPSSIRSSPGISGKPLRLFVEQHGFFLPYCKAQAYRPLAIACKKPKITVSFRSNYLDLLVLFFFVLFWLVVFFPLNCLFCRRDLSFAAFCWAVCIHPSRGCSAAFLQKQQFSTHNHLLRPYQHFLHLHVPRQEGPNLFLVLALLGPTFQSRLQQPRWLQFPNVLLVFRSHT